MNSSLTPRVSPPVSVLLALAERCEREEPSRLLDVEIAEAALGLCDQNVADRSFRDRGSMLLVTEDDRLNWRDAPKFTTSLDAAVTLVPANFLWAAGWAIRGHGGGYTARVSNLCGIAGEGAAATAVQCLCAAALRALAALHGEPR